MVAGRGRRELGKFSVAPVEPAGLDDHPAHGGAVAADVLGGRVHDDVGAPFDRPAQVGRGHRVVEDQRDAGVMRDGGERLDVDDVDQRVAERFGIDKFCIFPHRLAEVLRLIRGDKSRFNPQFLQVHVEQRMRTAVERRGRHDVIAGAAQREDRRHFRRLPGGRGKARASALERRHPLLEHRHRGVGDARVDVAERLQVEEARRVVRGVEDERGGLIDRRGARAGGGIRNLPRVQAKRLDAEFTVRHASNA